MKKLAFLLVLTIASFAAKSQKVETIYFNLYVDSLKKGVYNYINVDGKLSSGSFLPLMADEVLFSSSSGKWEGNNLIIDTSSKVDSVVITAALKARPEVKKTVTIWVKKVEIIPVLKTEKELLDEWTKKGKKKN
ncbi:hypothetical protein [Segetibacter aerophilus]|uniref:DUF4369 domain-containing protein n=1 Tax=Segetibacter aerophilus TaxID=670293 RepID=A0A512BDF2_9BACT|nr:hypothetical protein [Segetibacter aerophilus]GEO09989.1 hypothetical protein SAE01_24850 [Segetibacter aerophilus]